MYNRPPPDLYALLPQHFRSRDAEQGRPLQALIQLLARELQVVEQDLDQLYDNWFIETCEQWVIPYIAELVGARPLHPFGEGGTGLRAYVANTLGYRQAKGTVAAIEQIARDATGWPVLAVEFFQQLATSQHLNHVRPGAPAFASVRDAEAARRAHRPFDPHCHAPAAGVPTGYAGRYNIANVGLLIWRIGAYPIGFIVSEPSGYLGGPVSRASVHGPGLRHFDRLGRDIALANPPKADVSIAARVSERIVPEPLDRRRIHRDLEALRSGASTQSLWFDDEPVLRIRLDGVELAPQQLCCCSLETWDAGGGAIEFRRPQQPGEVCFDPELGRLSLHASDEDKSIETSYAYRAAFPVGGGPYDRAASLEAWLDDYFIAGEAEPWCVSVSARAADGGATLPWSGTVLPTLAQAIQAWNAQALPGARGIITVLDNGSYNDPLDVLPNVIRIPARARLAIVAAPAPIQQRNDAPQASGCWPHVRSDIAVVGLSAGPDDEPGSLLIDGLLVEGEVRVRDGALGRLSLRHATLGASQPELAGGVRVEAGNQRLAVELIACCAGRLALESAGGGLSLADSSIGGSADLSLAAGAMPLVIEARDADADIQSSTLFGRVEARSIEAGNSLFLDHARAAQRQRGCVRFCYAPPGSRLARRFRCQPELAIQAATAPGGALTTEQEAEIARAVRPIFTSTNFGDPAYGQLALTCPEAIRSGAEDGAELGAGFRLGEPYRRQNLADVLEEYLPFGLTGAPIFIS